MKQVRPVRHLFIAGCQRSGTTALLGLLNTDQRIMIGRERYKRCVERISPASFQFPGFFHPLPHETNYRDGRFYQALLRKWQSGTVEYVGDKTPFYYKVFPHISRSFEDFKILFLMRDLHGVAASYNARAADPEDRVWTSRMDFRQAVQDWNESLFRLQEFVRAGGGSRVFIVRYEDFFCGNQIYLESLYEFLELSLREPVRAAFLRMTGNWPARQARPSNLTAEMRSHLDDRRDSDLERWCLDRAPRR